MMRHLHTVLLLVLLSATGLRAQQVEQLSLYQVNPYVINPAYAGTSGDFEVALMNRNQCSGVEDAPRTFTLSLVAPFRIHTSPWAVTSLWTMPGQPGAPESKPASATTCASTTRCNLGWQPVWACCNCHRRHPHYPQRRGRSSAVQHLQPPTAF